MTRRATKALLDKISKTMSSPPERSAERGPSYACATRDPGSAHAVRDDTVKKVFIWKALVQAVPAPKAKLTCWWAIWRDKSPEHARGNGWVTRRVTKALLDKNSARRRNVLPAGTKWRAGTAARLRHKGRDSVSPSKLTTFRLEPPYGAALPASTAIRLSSLLRSIRFT